MSSPAVSSAIDYARENKQRFLSELKDLLRIPSVSTTEEHKDDVRKAAEMVASQAEAHWLQNVEIIKTQAAIRWFTATGCTPPASPPACVMPTSTFSRPRRWTSGSRLRLSTRTLLRLGRQG